MKTIILAIALAVICSGCAAYKSLIGHPLHVLHQMHEDKKDK
jgi:hypothetical protein